MSNKFIGMFKVGDKLILTGDNWDPYLDTDEPHYVERIAASGVPIITDGWHIEEDGWEAELWDEPKAAEVDHPAHYNHGGVEAIDVIEAWDLGFHLGNAVKYISRAGRKDPDRLIEDLEKSAWYINREIGRIRDERNSD